MKKTTLFISIAFMAALGFIALPASSAGDKGDGKAAVTFNKDVAPIFYKSCAECHRPGEIAPFSLLTYKEARPWARSIKEKVVTREMPPWHADPAHGEYLNDRRLTQKEIDTIVAWADQGAKEGDPKDLPKPPQYPDGWNIGKPDAVFYLPTEFDVPAEGVVEYKYFSVPTNFKQDMWVQAAEIRPGARSVVHHVIVFVQSGAERKLLVGYAPGEQPAIIPRGLARKIPAGANLVFQVHYTPNGTAVKDRSYVGLIFAKEPPKSELLTRPILNARFVIPPGHPNYRVESSFTFPEDGTIQSLMPHMHLRGKSFEYRVTFPDGTSKVILSVPKYSFAWQSYYILKEPVRAPKGTRVDCVAHFDNSAGNKYNPDPTKEVRWGDQTWEEMMIGWMSYTLDKTPNKSAAGEAVSRN
ncbi:MAG TPA: thiol-disulfide isomerase [Blastocatellia bacterium]|nr:thiol-disulfide isomerase [Blastocatellia bacterium]